MTTEELSITQAVAFSVMSALDGGDGLPWQKWAHAWLKGEDRSGPAAQRAWTLAIGGPARHAAAAARLLAEATGMQSEAAMLTAEGRNSRWNLDACDQKNAECLSEVAEAIRLATKADTAQRAQELRERAAREF